jgi:hypothetical protein
VGKKFPGKNKNLKPKLFMEMTSKFIIFIWQRIPKLKSEMFPHEVLEFGKQLQTMSEAIFPN